VKRHRLSVNGDAHFMLVEFDAAVTDTGDATAASRSRRDMTETHAPQKLGVQIKKCCTCMF